MPNPIQDSEKEIKKLNALNDDLENYFRNTIIPQLYIDGDFVLRKFTPPAMKQFDLSADDIGKNIDSVVHHLRFPTLIENIQAVVESGEDLEKEIQTTDLRWFQMNILPYKVFKENRTNGVIITFVDVTARINNLKEIEKLNSDHETFIYSVSHDLKGPLANLEGLVDTLKEVSQEESLECHKVAGMVSYSVGDLKKIINELTDISKVRYNLTKEAELVSVENILEEVQLTLKEAINEAGAKVRVEINASEVKFIRKNIRSIIYNLLSNAIKYKSPDRKPEILIKTEKFQGYVLLSVTDNGLGVEESQKEIIFSEFSRVDKSVEGTGVGLYIVNKMLKNSGGKIEVESTPGKGSTFKAFFKD